MDLTATLPYLLSLLIGISLGLIGGGGSILTVPILVYAASVEPVLATAYSLFVVGVSALVGSLTYMRKKLVSYRSAIIFGIPSVVAVYLTRAWLLPAIPETLFSIGGQHVSKGLGIMIFFSIVMLAAAVSMIRNGANSPNKSDEVNQLKYLFIIIEGMVVGILTGLVGAGGGFLIIPALVLFARLSMKLAVGTSLLIIAGKSLIGFTGDMTTNQSINWPFLLGFTAFAIGGIFVGNAISTRVDGRQLKTWFGWFVLVMGAFMLIRELLF